MSAGQSPKPCGKQSCHAEEAAPAYRRGRELAVHRVHLCLRRCSRRANYRSWCTNDFLVEAGLMQPYHECACDP